MTVAGSIWLGPRCSMRSSSLTLWRGRQLFLGSWPSCALVSTEPCCPGRDSGDEGLMALVPGQTHTAHQGRPPERGGGGSCLHALQTKQPSRHSEGPPCTHRLKQVPLASLLSFPLTYDFREICLLV